MERHRSRRRLLRHNALYHLSTPSHNTLNLSTRSILLTHDPRTFRRSLLRLLRRRKRKPPRALRPKKVPKVKKKALTSAGRCCTVSPPAARRWSSILSS